MNTGNRGKFSDRIKNIAYYRRNNKSDTKSLNFKHSVLHVLLFPLMLVDKKINDTKSSKIKDTSGKNNLSSINNYTNILNNTNKTRHIEYSKLNEYSQQFKVKKNQIISKKSIINKSSYKDERQSNINNIPRPNVINKNAINSTSKAYILRNDKQHLDNQLLSDSFSRQSTSNYNSTDVNNESDVKFSRKVKKDNNLVNKIITDIYKYLVKNIDKLELLESDLYILSKFDGQTESLEKCRKDIAKLNALKNKLNKITRQFNILRYNVDFDSILEIDDKFLLDELVQFRDSISHDISAQTVKNYKLLDEYNYLYSRLDKIVADVNSLEKNVFDRKAELEKVNIDFYDFQNQVYNIDDIEEKSNKIILEQQKKLNKISEKVANTSVKKDVDYIYKGFLDVFFTGLKLLGLYMLKPFKNSVPGIAVMTIATKKTMDNFIDAMHVEKRTKYIYSATNYGFELSSAINDLYNLDRLISITLSDVISMKSDFISKFSPYSRNLPKYNNVLKKINQIEKTMINNQLKVRVLSEKMRSNKKINDNTLVKVKKLNNN